jgi:hypothetical protein
VRDIEDEETSSKEFLLALERRVRLFFDRLAFPLCFWGLRTKEGRLGFTGGLLGREEGTLAIFDLKVRVTTAVSSGKGFDDDGKRLAQ